MICCKHFCFPHGESSRCYGIGYGISKLIYNMCACPKNFKSRDDLPETCSYGLLIKKKSQYL